jgi:hypothetical protein
MADFRKLGADRNAIAINKAVGSPGSGPIAIPVVDDVTTGQLFTVSWVTDDTSDTATVAVGLRKTVALWAQVSIDNRYIMDVSISGTTLSVVLDSNGADGDTASFWVF